MEKEKKIKHKHVLVIGSGPSVKIYWNKIERFIKENNVITFGCNHISDFIVPDYHFWGSAKRWREVGSFMDKKSIAVFPTNFSKKFIRKHWKYSYKRFKSIERLWKIGSEDKNSREYKRCRVYYKNGKMFGCFQDISTYSIFYAYIKEANKISVIGNDGYTLYLEKDLKNEKYSQHCYGNGLTEGYNYKYCRKEDWFKYRTLRLLYKYGIEKYGFGFEMITPTIYDKFYNSKVLDIENDLSWNKWKEPGEKEQKDLYKIKGSNYKSFLKGERV